MIWIVVGAFGMLGLLAIAGALVGSGKEREARGE